MKAITLELARKLKEAGLRWEPKRGDWCYLEDAGLTEPLLVTSYKSKGWVNDEDDIVWLPRLSQLLAEIEKRGYRWDIGNLGGFGDNEEKVCIGLFGWDTRQYVKGQFYADTPEDAAGKALLWILERICPNCGAVWYSADTSDRPWKCEKCGAEITKSAEEPAK